MALASGRLRAPSFTLPIGELSIANMADNINVKWMEGMNELIDGEGCVLFMQAQGARMCLFEEAGVVLSLLSNTDVAIY